MHIIAECAQGYAADNKDESISLAKVLVAAAKASTADSVKFQVINAEEICTRDYKYYELFNSLDIGIEGWREIKEFCDSKEIELILDIFGSYSLNIAEEIGVTKVKIHPTDFTNISLLERVAYSKRIKQVYAGSGGASRSEVSHAVRTLASSKEIVLVHGYQSYPTPTEDNNLQRIPELQRILDEEGVKNGSIGFADHDSVDKSEMTCLSAIAVGLGAKVIEKHITLAKCMKLEDYEAALDPDSFKVFAEVLRLCEKGKGNKGSKSFSFSSSEQKYREFVSRHVVASKDISANERIGPEEISLKRSGSENPITCLSEVVGKIAIKNIPAGNPIESGDLLK